MADDAGAAGDLCGDAGVPITSGWKARATCRGLRNCARRGCWTTAPCPAQRRKRKGPIRRNLELFADPQAEDDGDLIEEDDL